MKDLFHHTYTVKGEDGRFRPVRFTDKQMDLLEKISPVFGSLGRCTAGVSLKFYTDAEEISFHFEYTILYTNTGGFDVYENNVMYCSIELPEESCESVFTYRKTAAGKTLIEIFFPANAEVEVWDLKLGDHTPFFSSNGGFILYYGDSITQSAYMKTPSLSFPSLVSILTGAQYLNRGVGSLFYDESYLDENDSLKPDVVFVEFGANDLVKHDAGNKVVMVDNIAQHCDADDIPVLIQRAEKYLTKLKAIYPTAKINVISPLYSCEQTSQAFASVKIAYKTELHALVDKLGLSFIDGTHLSAHIPECHVQDGIHLTALGNALVAQSLIHILRK